MAKLPKLDHVKYVKRGLRVYAYFNTGKKTSGGKPIYAALPKPSAIGFYDSYAAFMAGRTKREKPGYTVASLIEDYRASPHFAKKALATRTLYSLQLGKIAEAWGSFPVDKLDAESVRYVLDREKWNAGTRNMVLAVLGTLYTWGRRNGKATVWPTKDIEREEGGSHQPWPQDIVEAALASDDPIVRLGVHLLYFTGQRIGDVCKMRWGDIRGGYIYVRQTKTGKVVEPPLIAELQAELDRTPRNGILILDGINHNFLRRALKAFTSKLGVETVPHGLRKNAVNALLEAGCTVPEVAAITGQTHAIVEHYAAQVNRKKLGKAAIVKFERARAK